MDARSLKMKNQDDNQLSDDGTNNDYSSDDFIDSDDNTIVDEVKVNNVIGTRSKRFHTSSYRDVVNGFRKHTSSMSSADGKSNTNLKSIERMPTRRPNPKICNRNAVMARENRRKKKEYLEGLQKDVDQFQSENKKLRKLLGARNNMIAKLTHESMYLKSVLANKTEIMALLKTIQGSRIPITSSALSFVTDPHPYNSSNNDMKREKMQSYECSSSGCSPASASSICSPSPYTEDEKENGTNWLDSIISNHDDPFLTTALIDPNSLFTDFDFPAGNDLQWESLLNHNSGLKSSSDQSSFMIPELLNIDDCDILSTNASHNVNHEHNYFNNPVKSAKVDDESRSTASPTINNESGIGVCLHVNNGKVSLEFCSACHSNSQNAWVEEM